MASQNTNGEVSTDALSNNNEETEVCSTQLPEVDKVQTLRARKKAFRQSMHEHSKGVEEQTAKHRDTLINPDKVGQRAKDGEVESLKYFISQGVDVNAHVTEGGTALVQAAYANRVKACELLLENGADIEAVTEAKRTSLMIACERGNTEVVDLLLRKGAEVNKQDIYGYTALMLAAQSNAGECCQKLVEYGADTEIKSYDDNNLGPETPIQIAARVASPDAARVLCEAGCDLKLLNKYNYTVENLCQSARNKKLSHADETEDIIIDEILKREEEDG